jgi:hypothetical protein
LEAVGVAPLLLGALPLAADAFGARRLPSRRERLGAEPNDVEITPCLD